jgi:hypothetical protein
MNARTPARDALAPATIRKILLWTLIAGADGTLAELLLIGHDESSAQFIPLALLALAVVAGVTVLATPTVPALLLLKLLMVLFVASGPLGVVLHYRGNQEFELERQPSATGWPLMSKTLTGATPVLAPGSMSLLGVIGLVCVHRHPLSQPSLSEEA